MKNITLIFGLLTFSSVLYAQRTQIHQPTQPAELVEVVHDDHNILEHLFEGKSILQLEMDLNLDLADYENQPLIDYIDERYQAFYEEMRNLVGSFSTITQQQFDIQYNEMVAEISAEKVGIKPGEPLGDTKAADGPCVNMDFETGDHTGWTLTRGNVDGSAPYSFVGEFPVGPGPYHTIFGGGVDPVTGIPRVNPTGGGFSLRLGNGTGTGARAARIKQTFLVDPTNYMFTYSYAVVFESPAGHTLNELPYFTVRVMDSLGNDVPCGEYSVIADAANAPNYESTTWGGTTVLYQNWQTTFANLSAYIGQNVTVEFSTGDCALTGHFGYAYIDAECGIDELTASNNIICVGDSAILSAPVGAASYLWSNGATTQTTTVYTGGLYSCTLVPNQGGGCSVTLDITITENPSPTANFSLNTPVVCLGDLVNLTDLSSIPAPGSITGYRWDFGDGIITPISSGPIVGVSATTGTYLLPSHLYAAPGVYNIQLYVESADGCTDSIVFPITVNPLPVVVAGIDQTVCDGETVTLTGSGAVSYAWGNGVTDGLPFVSPIGTTTYTVTGTDANGCVNTDQVDVIVNPLPIVDAGIDQMVCDGEAFTLNGSGATSYTWNNGITDGTPFVQAVGTITYTVTGTDTNGCVNTDQVNVNVNPLPIVNAGPDQTVCDGEAVTLSGSGATSYTWDNGVVNGVSFVQAVGLTTYTVTGTDANGCVNMDQVDVTVNPLPAVNAGVDQIACEGSSITLNGSGASSYTWNNGVTDGVPFVQGVGSTLYTVTGTDANGCVNTDQVSVTINALPIVVAGPDQTVCDGEAVTLSASGATSYTWDNGITNGVSFVQVVGTMTYTVTGTDANGCVNTDQVDVIVNPLPIVNAGVDQTVCDGEAVTLNGSGATSYTWDNGVVNGVPFVQAIGTTSYTVTGTDANGCVNTDQVDVTVNPLPVVNSGADQIACAGSSVTLNGSGASSYTWDNGVTDGVPFGQGVGITIYTVTGTDANGCVNTDQVSVTINALPAVVAGPDQTVCDGVSVTLNGAGASSYVWNNGVIDGVPFVQGVGTTTYSVIGTDANGCSNSDDVDIIVNALPVVSAGADQTECENTPVTLSGSGATSYLWDNGVIDGIAFIPSPGITSYTVTGTDANGCVNTDQVDVTTNALPNVVAGPDQAVCDGSSVTLSGAGANTYSWSGGIVDGVPFTPAVGQYQFIVTGTDVLFCSNDDTVLVTVYPNPIVLAGMDQTLCEGSLVTLNAIGGPNLYWNNAVINNTPFSQVIGVVDYVVYDSVATGCTSSDTVRVEILPNPVVTANDAEICEGEGVTLTGQGAVTYSWTGGVVNAVEFYPTATATYTVTGTDANGCSAQATSTVTVHPKPIANFKIDDMSLTSIDPTTGFGNLSTGAVTYEWNFGDGSPISNEFEPTHTFPLDESGEYAITLTVYSSYGCPAQKTKYVHVYPDYTVFVPNSFTPNGDGSNDIFKPETTGLDPDEYTLYIFNRWGNLIFESHNLEVGWDGTFAGQDFQVQDGVYTWKILAGIKDSSDSKIFVGHVVLLQ